MPYDPARHHRHSIRLRSYDYTLPGHYFVTINVQHQACLFGDMRDGEVELSQAGWVIEWWWQDLPNRFPGIALDAFVVMPDHFHGIVVIDPLGTEEGTHIGVPVRQHASPSLGQMIGWFKSMTTTDYIRGVKTLDWPPFQRRLWHRNYFEHIIRDEQDLERIRAYIASNPADWTPDDHQDPHDLFLK